MTLGRLRARRGDPGQWAPLDEALDAGRADRESSLRLAAGRGGESRGRLARGSPRGRGRDDRRPRSSSPSSARIAGLIGELAYWRWRAGIEEEIPPGAAEPYALQIAGEWRRAADLWAELGCPYEHALALADADDDETLLRALEELQRLGARPAAGQGIGLILYGVLVIGLVDNLLRPFLVGKDTKLPDYVVLISTLGGIEVFGLNGFVIGPLIAAMFMVSWEIFSASRRTVKDSG